jgi:hypothetical protein
MFLDSAEADSVSSLDCYKCQLVLHNPVFKMLLRLISDELYIELVAVSTLLALNKSFDSNAYSEQEYSCCSDTALAAYI